ncbi:hypothetical protein [Streptomyces sp. NPDC047974]|uniref:hypothetical protein n=1 Tax=Streptomyces sp. NPDC047974 TaxID=3154343 RepID=UPI0033DF307B
MLLTDRSAGLVPFMVSGVRRSLLDQSALLHALVSLFELVWERATPNPTCFNISPVEAHVGESGESGEADGSRWTLQVSGPPGPPRLPLWTRQRRRR